jgi:hypothetical protein
MPTSRTHQNSFTRGEVDETIIARTDIASFQQSLKRARNVFTLNQGAIERRAGTLYRADLGAQSRLEGFVFNDTQEYILAFQNTALKIYSSNGTLLQTITSCPWTTSILFQLNVTQQGDTMVVVHADMTPQVIKRTSATTFTRTDFAFKDSVNGQQKFQPYFKFADDTITLDINTSTAGSVTAVTSADYFTSSYVGTRIRYHGSEISGYTNATTVTGTLKKNVSIELDDDPFATKQGTGTIKVTHVAHGFSTGASVTIEGAEDIFNDDGNGIAAGNLNGAKTITVEDDNHYIFTADNSDTANDSQDGGGVNVTIVAHPPTRSWDEQVFSAVNGFPKTAKFHQQRLFFGGGTSLPDFIAGSKTADFFNFDVGDAQDTDSIQINISSDRINEIRHLISGKNLEILTSTGEFYLKPQVGKPLTPVDLQIIRQSNLGCSLSPMPRIFDGAGLFVQNNGRNVREYFFNSAVEEYTPTLINTLSPQAISNPSDSAIVRSAGKRTEQYILFVNDDGSIGVFTAHRQEKLAGWVLWTTDGLFESVAGITSFLYTAVKRTVNGVTVYNLEQWANSPFAVPTDCTVSKTLSGSYQPHGSPAINGAVTSTKQITVDGFTNAPSVGESFQFAGTGTTFTIQSVNASGNTNEYILILDAVTSQSNNTTLVFTTSKVFTGLNATPSLIGKVVHATSGSNEDDAIFYYGSGTVSSGGVVSFQNVASSCDIGLDYTVDIETLPIDAMQSVRGLGSLYGFPKKIGKTVLELNKTYNLQLNAKDVLLSNGITTSSGLTSFTGKKEIYALGYSTQPSIKISQSIPVPFRILSITSEVMY